MVFGLFSPKPPLGPQEKAWVEVRMAWLAEQFGFDRMRRAEVIVPSDRHFPDAYDATPDAARRYLDRICRYMDIDPSQIELRVLAKDDMPGAAGLFEPGLVYVADTQLDDPEALVATLAHELAHELLYRANLLQDGEPDFEWVTDLLPVFLGLGVFPANACMRERNEQYGHMHWSFMNKQGYLPARMIGYALALFAWAREDDRPRWAEHLRHDARESLRISLRYLQKTEDTVFDPRLLRAAKSSSVISEVIRRAESGTPSTRVAAIWELAKSPDAARAMPTLQALLRHRNAAVAAEAARALAVIGPVSEAAIHDLIDLLRVADPDLSTAAAYALGRLAQAPETVIPELLERIADPQSRGVASAATMAIAQYGPAARPVLPAIQAALRRALETTSYEAIEDLLQALLAVAPDSDAAVNEVIASCDPELRGQAKEILADCSGDHPTASVPGSWFGRRYA